MVQVKKPCFQRIVIKQDHGVVTSAINGLSRQGRNKVRLATGYSVYVSIRQNDRGMGIGWYSHSIVERPILNLPGRFNIPEGRMRGGSGMGQI
jgi:hypothetical protein